MSSDCSDMQVTGSDICATNNCANCA